MENNDVEKWIIIEDKEDGILIGNAHYTRDVATVWKYGNGALENHICNKNAKLIISAPIMVEALINCVQYLTDINKNHWYIEELNKIIKQTEL